MVKNNDGVHVIIPSVNKTFKVNSSWPNNSSYPYLLQSIAHDIVSDDNIIINKDGDYTILELKVKLFNREDGNTQKIIFDQTGLPKEVYIYNKNNEHSLDNISHINLLIFDKQFNELFRRKKCSSSSRNWRN